MKRTSKEGARAEKVLPKGCRPERVPEEPAEKVPEEPGRTQGWQRLQEKAQAK
jgi:hypothetical protein